MQTTRIAGITRTLQSYPNMLTWQQTFRAHAAFTRPSTGIKNESNGAFTLSGVRRSYAGGSDVEGEDPKTGGADGVRATYQLFQHRVPALSEANAPALFQYLSTTGG